MKKILFPVLALCFSLSFAQFDDDEWANFDYEHAGLSQTEFQRVRNSDLTKDKLMYLLEIGIRPSEYLNEPWKNLGVSESQWLDQRSKGMEDSDIDRTYKNQHGNQNLAWVSFALPSFYQWKTDQMAKAIAMNVSYAVILPVTIFVLKGGDRVQIGLPVILGIHAWSGIDAIVATQWDSNPDARNFSWGVVPTGKDSFAAAALFRF